MKTRVLTLKLLFPISMTVRAWRPLDRFNVVGANPSRFSPMKCAVMVDMHILGGYVCIRKALKSIVLCILYDLICQYDDVKVR